MARQDPVRAPFLAAWLLRRTLRPEDADAGLGDLEEWYLHLKAQRSRWHAWAWLWWEVAINWPRLWKNKLYWRSMMFKNYLKMALRIFARSKLYTVLNIAGLAVGMAACLLLYNWVQDELAYDRFNGKADQIYRVERRFHYQDMRGDIPVTGGPYGEALKNDYPAIEEAVRVWPREYQVKDAENVWQRQPVIATESSLFTIFDFKLSAGDPETALNHPNTLILTLALADRYFGSGDVLGKTLGILMDDGQVIDFTITGILEPVPRNAHFTFDMALSITSFSPERLATWANNFLYTYVLLNETARPETLEAQFDDFLTKYLAPAWGAFLPPGVTATEVVDLYLKPLTRIHLNPSEQWEIGPQGSRATVTTFSAIAVLILLIACFNFMNLSSARASKRAREVGLRKTVGAERGQLFAQFVGESLLLATLAALFSVGLILVALPTFNNLSGKGLTLAHFFQGQNTLVFLGIILVTGLIAGLYPAFYLTSFKPSTVLKGREQGKTRTTLRNTITVFQFILSIALIVGTLTVARQMRYIQSKSLGFDKENVVVLQAGGNVNATNYDRFKTSLLADPRVMDVSASTDLPGDRTFSDTIFKQDGGEERLVIFMMWTHYDFDRLLKLKLLAGRYFAPQFATDDASAIVINETAARQYGWSPQEAVNQTLTTPSSQAAGTPIRIIGVVEDLHFKTLHNPIEPMGLLFSRDATNLISIRLRPGDHQEAVQWLEGQWHAHFAEEPFLYSFLDQDLAQRYEADDKVSTLFFLFAALSLLVACLGLFGLAAFTAQEKTKEIGVRKVLGASIVQIVLGLFKRFGQWVVLANLIAWPLSWYFMKRWLEGFAYKVPLSADIFILAGLIALAIAILTVSQQAIKAALANPIKSLKYE